MKTLGGHSYEAGNTLFRSRARTFKLSVPLHRTGAGAASSSGSGNTAGMSSSSTGTGKVERPAVAREENGLSVTSKTEPERRELISASRGAELCRSKRELKLRMPARGVAAFAKARLPRFSKGRAERARLVSTYFDTAKHKLRRHGLTLRVREIGAKKLQTVKADTLGQTVRCDCFVAVSEVADRRS
jgi:CYTH domain-containing protein